MGSVWKLMMVVAFFAILMSPTEARFSNSVAAAQQTMQKATLMDVLKIMRKSNNILHTIRANSGEDIKELITISLRLLEPYLKPFAVKAKDYYDTMMEPEDQE